MGSPWVRALLLLQHGAVAMVEVQGAIRWPRMPRPVERRILRVLDVFLHYTGYAGRYRRRMLKALRQQRRERQPCCSKS